MLPPIVEIAELVSMVLEVSMAQVTLSAALIHEIELTRKAECLLVVEERKVPQSGYNQPARRIAGTQIFAKLVPDCKESQNQTTAWTENVALASEAESANMAYGSQKTEWLRDVQLSDRIQ